MSVDAVKLGELQDVKSVPDAAVVTISSPTGAQQVSFANLIKQVEDRVKADLLGGCIAGNMIGNIPFYEMLPNYDKLVEMGYNTADKLHDTVAYLQAMLKYLNTKVGNRIYLGTCCPGSTGMILVRVHQLNEGEGALPKYANGIYLTYNSEDPGTVFGTMNGKFYASRLQATKLV